MTEISGKMFEMRCVLGKCFQKIFKLRKIKKNFDKSKIFYILRALFSTTSWRDGRVVECTGLENRQSARAPGFESLSLRHLKTTTSFRGSFYFMEGIRIGTVRSTKNALNGILRVTRGGSRPEERPNPCLSAT